MPKLFAVSRDAAWAMDQDREEKSDRRIRPGSHPASPGRRPDEFEGCRVLSKQAASTAKPRLTDRVQHRSFRCPDARTPSPGDVRHCQIRSQASNPVRIRQALAARALAGGGFLREPPPEWTKAARGFRAPFGAPDAGCGAARGHRDCGGPDGTSGATALPPRGNQRPEWESRPRISSTRSVRSQENPPSASGIRPK